jgi:D-lyxose ketol-isomerase
MKRSEINHYIAEAIAFFQERHFYLPPFAFFSKGDWAAHKEQTQEIFDLHLGWDLTSFGTDDFLNTGLLLFTLRNGLLGSSRYAKPYAEKIMIVRVGQVTPRHFHWHKREDIINRGGGDLAMEVWKADEDNRITDEPFDLSLDGIRRTFRPGDRLALHPGESVCFEPYIAHRFYGEKSTVLVGEVSMVNDDANDNCFVDGQPRFDEITEDEAPLFYLASDYKALLEELS